MLGAYLEIKALRECSSELVTQQRQIIENYAQQHRISINEWLASKSLKSCLKKLHAGDTLLASEISCLGKSLSSIKSIIGECIRRKITLIIVNGNYVFEDTPQDRLLLSAIDMVIRLQAELKSQIMRDKLQQLRCQGRKLGRPRGSGNKKLKLSDREQEIRGLLEQNLSKAEIARRLGVNRMTLYAFLERRPK